MRNPLSDAEDYIDASMRTDSGNMGLIAWKFLVGCRILECMDDMNVSPKQGTDVEVIHLNKDNSTLRLGKYEITIAHKPEGKSEDL